MVRDSLGVRIVENYAPALSQGSWHFDSIPQLEIGAIESSDPEYLFSGLRQAVRLSDGRIAVVDRGRMHISVFAADGRFLNTVGRDGGGPGEFMSTPTIALAGLDTIVAWDQRTLRVSWFTASGLFLRSLSMAEAVLRQGIPRIGGGATWRLLPDGSLLSTVGRTGTDLIPTAARPVLVSGARDAPVMFGEYAYAPFVDVERADGMRISIRRPFVGGVYIAVATNAHEPGVLIAGHSGWQYSTYDLDGGLRQIVRARVRRVPVNNAMIEEHIAASSASTGLPLNVIRRSINDLRVPDSLPAIAGIATGPAGEVIVARWQPGRGTSVYDVFSAQGRWLTTLIVPQSIGQILEWGEDYVLAAHNADLDVPYLRLFRLNRQGTDAVQELRRTNYPP